MSSNPNSFLNMSLDYLVHSPKNISNAFVDTKRVVGYLAPHIGTLFIRKGNYVRLGLATLILYMADVKDKKDLEWFLGFPLLAAVKGTGFYLKFGRGFMNSKYQAIGSDAGLDKIRSQKREGLDKYIDTFWKYTYRDEATTIFSEKERENQRKRWLEREKVVRRNILNEKGWVYAVPESDTTTIDSLVRKNLSAYIKSPSVPKVREAFRSYVDYFLDNSCNLDTKIDRVGIDLTMLSDYMSSSFFTSNDDYLSRAYNSNPLLVSIRKKAKRYSDYHTFNPKSGVGNFMHTIKLVLKGFKKSFWHKMTASNMSSILGEGVFRLRKKHGTERVKAETITLLGSEESHWVSEYDGLWEDIVDLRNKMINKTYGNTPHAIDRMIRRTSDYDIINGIMQRLHTDYLYLDRETEVTIVRDLIRIGADEKIIEYYKSEMNHAMSHMDYFDRFLRDHFDHFFTKNGDDEFYQMFDQCQIARYMAKHYDRLENFLKQQPDALIDLYYKHHKNVKYALKHFKDWESLLKEKDVPQELIDPIRKYYDGVVNRSYYQDYHMNDEVIRAIKTAYHMNYKNLRKLFLKNFCREHIGAFDRGEAQRIKDIIRIVQRNYEEFTSEIEQVREYHGLVMVNDLMYRDAVDDIREKYTTLQAPRFYQIKKKIVDISKKKITIRKKDQSSATRDVLGMGNQNLKYF